MLLLASIAFIAGGTILTGGNFKSNEPKPSIGLNVGNLAPDLAFANPEGFEPKFEKLVNKVKQWCKLWSQESIGLEFENDLFYIEQDSKFAKGGKVKNPSPDYPDFVSMQYAKGGLYKTGMDKKPAKFKDKVKAISKSLEGKKVPKKVRKDYGMTYDKKESVDAAKRIAGSMAKKERKRYEI